MQSVFSVPCEFHVIAESAQEALAIAASLPSTVHTDNGDSGSLYVATDKSDDVDIAE
jgi:hypothetical protein